MSSPYIQPTSTVSLPRGFTLTQFIQTVMVGVSGLSGPFVRPKWQVEPPKQPDLDVNWMAIGIDICVPDANGYVWPNQDGSTYSQRMETLEVGCSIYGPDALEIYGLIRDGFQIEQNRWQLNAAGMGFIEVTTARKIPDLFNQRWIERVVTSVFLRREIQRIYAVPTIISANGIIYVPDISEDFTLNWATAS